MVEFRWMVFLHFSRVLSDVFLITFSSVSDFLYRLKIQDQDRPNKSINRRPTPSQFRTR